MGFFDDIRFALRMWRNAPGFAFSALVLVSFAMAVNGTVITIVDRLVFSTPAGIADAGRVVRTQNARLRRPDQYVNLAENLRTMAVSAQSDLIEVSVDAGGEPELVSARFVTPNGFSLLGARPLVGQLFAPHDERAMRDGVVIGHSLWRRRFAEDPGLVGRSVRVGDRIRTIVGVAAEGFTGHDRRPVDVWLPAADAARTADGYWLGSGFELIGRLANGVSLEQAQAELHAQYPTDAPILARQPGASAHVELTPVSETLTTRLSKLNPLVISLVGAAAALLMIACANVSGLLVNRMARRSHEIAVRLHLGATHARIVRQVLTEILLLNVVAGVTAFVLVQWMIPIVIRVLGPPIPGGAPNSLFPGMVYGLELPGEVSPSLHFRILVVAGVAVLVATVLSGLAPALAVTRADLNRWLSTKDSPDRRQTTLRALLLAVQVALTVILLLAAGLFVRSFQNALGVDVGIDVQNVLITPLDQQRKDASPAFISGVIERLRAAPSVTHVSLSSSVPLGRVGKLQMAIEIPGYEWPWGEAKPAGSKRAFVEGVSPEYFSLLGIRIVHGRGFSEVDSAAGRPVVVIDETVAREVFRGESPLGKCVHLAYDPMAPGGLFKRLCRQIVGVATPVRLELVHFPGLDEGEHDPAFYVPVDQWDGARYLSIRTRSDFTSAAAEVGLRLQHGVDPEARYLKLERLSSHLDQQTHGWRLASGLFGTFGLAGLLLAAVGTYSLLALVVGQRTHEIGIRVALGATLASVARTIIVMALVPVAIGVAFGLSGGIVLMQLLATLLFGVTATDPTAIVGVGLLTLMVALHACAIPTVTGARVNLAVSLRQE